MSQSNPPSEIDRALAILAHYGINVTVAEVLGDSASPFLQVAFNTAVELLILSDQLSREAQRLSEVYTEISKFAGNPANGSRTIWTDPGQATLFFLSSSHEHTRLIKTMERFRKAAVSDKKPASK